MASVAYPFVLTKSEVRALVEFAKKPGPGQGLPWAILFQPDIEKQSRVIASDGCTMAIRFGGARINTKGDFAVSVDCFTALSRAIPTGGGLHIGAKDGKKLQFRVYGKFSVTHMLEGECIRETSPRLAGAKIGNYIKPLSPRTRYERLSGAPEAVGFDPRFLRRLDVVRLAVSKKPRAAEWCLSGALDPVKFVLRDERGVEKWRIIIMPMRIR